MNRPTMNSSTHPANPSVTKSANTVKVAKILFIAAWIEGIMTAMPIKTSIGETKRKGAAFFALFGPNLQG